MSDCYYSNPRPLSILFKDLFHFKLEFSGSIYALFLLSTFVYFYGGYPFLKGFLNEIRDKNIGMMTLIATAISAAYFYSSAVAFGLKGEVFFWELATLIDIMLLGHWIEMRSVLGASRALEELVRIMPSEAHLIKDGQTMDVKVDTLKPGDRVLVKLVRRYQSMGCDQGRQASTNRCSQANPSPLLRERMIM